ncbi:MAG: hypothetical protein ACOYLS_00650 [Polymorphobacter sp.]
MAIFVKDPAATIDYAIDWSANFPADQMVTGSMWQVLPNSDDGVAVAAMAIEPRRTIVTLSGGISGELYHITNMVTFSDGRSDERTLILRVEDR